ncbi:MAG: radical SAM protein [bacterium]
MGGERYILRDETFGGVLYDRRLLKYDFLHRDQISATSIFLNGQKIESFKHWQTEMKCLRTDILYSPIRIYIERTRKCNLRCDTCFNSSGTEPEGELTTDELKKCFDGMRKDNVLDLRFSGGEITTKPNWHEEVDYAKNLGFAVSVNTNGVYQNPDKTVDQLASLRLDQITISIDGNQENHDKNRGRGTHAKAMEALKELKRKGTPMRTNTVLTTLSIDDPEATVQEVGPYVEEMAFFHMRVTGRAEGIPERRVDFFSLLEFYKRMEVLEKRYPNIRFFYKERAIRNTSIMPNEYRLKVGSPDGLTRLNLNSDGSLWAGGYTAYIDPNLRLGNIKDENYSLRQIWNNSPILESYRDFGQQLVERCLSCAELDMRCPGVNVEMELIRKKLPQIGNPNCIY